jgi:hypothetical protein
MNPQKRQSIIEKGARGRACLYRTAPLPAPGNRFRNTALETENESRGKAHVVLCLRPRGPHAESRHQVLCLNGANGEVIKHFVIHTAARGHGEGILRTARGKGARVGVCRAEKYLSERCDPPEMAVGYPRSEEVC